MLHLRKGKKEVIKFESLYEFAEMTDLLSDLFGETNAAKVQQFAARNAFAIAISGAKLRLGNGYIVEKC